MDDSQPHKEVGLNKTAPKTAFVCGTPLQLLGCIDLVFHQLETGSSAPDLYLRHDFTGSGELAQRLSAAGIFGNVFQIGTPGGKPFSIRGNEPDTLPERPLELLRQQIGSSYGAPENTYAKLVFTYPYDTVKALFRLNPRAEIVTFEDGIGSYFGDILTSNGGSLLPHPQRLYLWNARMYTGGLIDDVRSLPSMAEDAAMQLIVAEIFGITARSLAPYQGKRCIYLTQPIDGKPERERELRETIAALEPWRAATVVRRHPRDNAPEAPGFTYDRENAQWELLCLAGVIDSTSVLVSSISTAQLSPKLLHDAEPTLIFTARLDGRTATPGELSVIETIRNAYRDRERIVVPRTTGEFRAALERSLA